MECDAMDPNSDWLHCRCCASLRAGRLLLSSEISSPLVEFSTRDVPAEHRIAKWESHNAHALIGLRCRTLGAPVLTATEINLQMEHLRVARVTATSHVVERSAELIKTNQTDAVALYFALAGESFFYSDDGVRVLRPGQMLACDADRPFMRGFSQGLHELVVTVPHDVFTVLAAERTVRVPFEVSFLAAGNVHAHALATLLGRAVHPARPVVTLEEGVLDLLAVAVGGRAAPVGVQLTAAKIFIDRHLGDSGLSAARIAAGVGISERQLSRVFAQQGLSIPRYVLKRRLDLVHKMLNDPARHGQTTVEMARQCGFSSASHFAREFKELFGTRPADVRRQARALTA